jgi:hypothetical protein
MKANLKKICLILVLVLLPVMVSASENYPKVANYYLNWFDQRQYAKLARYDLLILQPEMLTRNRRFFNYYHWTHDGGRILAYLYPASFYRSTLFYDDWSARAEVLKTINDSDWWLRDSRTAIVSPWTQISAVNITLPAWQDYNLAYLNKTYQLSKYWDGVFWDLVDAEPSRYSTYPLDVNADGQTEEASVSNQLWQDGLATYFHKARRAQPDKVMIINGSSVPGLQGDINGRMFEHFPTPWEGDGSWSATMNQYLYALPVKNVSPATYVINARYDNKSDKSIYQQMRFALASTLLGDGYFSFDAGANSHSQMWWFDEYDFDLGRATSQPINRTGTTAQAQPGLWSRDFEKGLVLVNSAQHRLSLKLPAGQYRYFKGVEDEQVNSACPVDYIILEPQDGVLLSKINGE